MKCKIQKNLLIASVLAISSAAVFATELPDYKTAGAKDTSVAEGRDKQGKDDDGKLSKQEYPALLSEDYD